MAYAASSEQLARSPVFATLPAEELANLAAMMARRPYKRGQVIFHQDDPGASVHLIESGRVKVVLTTEERDDRGRAGPLVEQRQLAEDLAGREHPQ